MGWIKIATLLTDPQINADWNATVGVAEILNKPTLFSGDYNDLSNKPVITGGGVTSYLDLTDKPAIPSSTSQLTNNSNYQTGTQVASSITTAISSKVNAGDLAAVATSGSYLDLSNTPASFSGAYADLSGKPTIPTVPSTVSSFTNDAGYLVATDIAGKANTATTYTKTEVDTALSGKQASGAYLVAADITGKADSSSLATVATSGSYDDILNKPSITSTIAGATDAVITTPANNQVLTYDSALSKWKNATAAGGTFYGGGDITSNTALGTSALALHSSSASGISNTALGANTITNDYATHDNVSVGTNALRLISSGISGITITAGGSGYTVAPTVTISAPASGGVQAVATASVSSGAILFTSLTNVGSKYDSSATITVTGVGTGAVLTPVVNAGSFNTAVGAFALDRSTGCMEQTAIGYKALYLHTAGTANNVSNTAVGAYALATSAMATSSVAIGRNSIGGATNATGCVAVGNATLGASGATLVNCTAIGDKAGSNTGSINITCVGASAGTYGTAGGVYVGNGAGYFASGVGNLAIGNNALYAYGTGTYNLMIGYTAGTAITSGSYNCCIGYESMKTNTAGGYSTSLGYKTLTLSNSAAEHNVAIGYQAGVAITSGNSNTLVGSNAGLLISGSVENTLIGRNAGSILTTGTNNTCIGYMSQPLDNASSNQVTLGNASITALRCAATSITSLSDVRDKSHIANLPTGLEFVNHLRPVSFLWNTRDGAKVGIPAAGFVAQDLEATQELFGADYLDLVSTDNPDKLEARYANLLPVYAKAIQELSQLVSALQYEVNCLKGNQ